MIEWSVVSPMRVSISPYPKERNFISGAGVLLMPTSSSGFSASDWLSEMIKRPNMARDTASHVFHLGFGPEDICGMSTCSMGVKTI